MPTIAGTDYRKTAALSDHALGDRFFASCTGLAFATIDGEALCKITGFSLVVRKVPQRRSTRCYGGSEYIANGLCKQFVATGTHAPASAARVNSGPEQGL